MCSILLSYQARLGELHAAASQLRGSRTIALIVFLIAIVLCCVLTYSSLVKQKVRLPIALAPLPIAAYACKIYFERRSLLLNRLRIALFYEKGCRRLQGSWAGSGEYGGEFLPDDHPYASDLNVVGPGSLFELICTCRTQVGRRRLADYLLNPVSNEESRRRQEAIRELQTNTELREQIAVLGKFEFQGSSWDAITAWLARPISQSPRLIRAIALFCSSAIVVLCLLGFDDAVRWNAVLPWIGLLLAGNTLIGVSYRRSTASSTQSTCSVAAELSTLREGLQLMRKHEFAAGLLRELTAASGLDHLPKHVRKLERFTGAFVARDREWFYLPSRLLLVGTQLHLAIESWRQHHSEALLKGLTVWGEFEALVALANYAYEHPENTFPKFSPCDFILDARDVGHPLLQPETCVRNNIKFDKQTRFYVVNGSNMAGKSTMLRTIGLNVVLAASGAPVCARQMTLSRLQLCTSIAVQDSLSDGKSKFLAEMERMKHALAMSDLDGHLLFLIDEILSGTNSLDRRTAAELILGSFIERGAIGALSTHDLSLTELAAIDGLHGKNMHMQSGDAMDPLKFDYLLKPGIATQTNAIAIARLAGVPI